MLILKTRTRIFLILWIASIVSSVLVLPYVSTIQAELLKKAGISFPFLVLIAIIQGGIAFGIASILGLFLAEKTGFKLPLLSSWIENKKINFKGTFWLSVILGLIAGISIFVVDKFIFPQPLLSSIKVQLWQGFLACIYGGIAEEVFMRLLLVSLFVFIFVKIFGRKENNSVIAWMAIILVSVLFGIGHLPIASAVVKITPMVVLRVIVLNGIGGVIFGWLYWKKGLESAIISHFSADIVLQIIVPVLLT
jgi:membrane protease YdiL (CAAX protease family)